MPQRRVSSLGASSPPRGWRRRRRRQQATRSPTDDFDRSAMLANLGTNVLLPIQTEFAAKAALVPPAIGAYCDALDAGTVGATLDAARAAWRSRDRYVGTRRGGARRPCRDGQQERCAAASTAGRWSRRASSIKRHRLAVGESRRATTSRPSSSTRARCRPSSTCCIPPSDSTTARNRAGRLDRARRRPAERALPARPRARDRCRRERTIARNRVARRRRQLRRRSSRPRARAARSIASAQAASTWSPTASSTSTAWSRT